MLRRGLCLVLALQMAAVHLPMRSWCAEIQPADEELRSLTLPAPCPCDPTASKCECCCSESCDAAAPSNGVSIGRCACGSPGDALAAANIYVDPPLPGIIRAEPEVGQIIDAPVSFSSLVRAPEPPPPR